MNLVTEMFGLGTSILGPRSVNLLRFMANAESLSFVAIFSHLLVRDYFSVSPLKFLEAGSKY